MKPLSRKLRTEKIEEIRGALYDVPFFEGFGILGVVWALQAKDMLDADDE